MIFDKAKMQLLVTIVAVTLLIVTNVAWFISFPGMAKAYVGVQIVEKIGDSEVVQKFKDRFLN